MARRILAAVGLVVLVVAGTGCTTKGGDDCTVGTQGCACDNGSCQGGLSCQGNVCTANACTPGNKDCACKGDNTCNVGPGGVELSCTNGTCTTASCIPSSEGCACAGNMRCGINAQGEQLTCQSGICAVASCTPGMTGCACTSASTCNADGDECRDGFCRPAGCTVGELNCECAGGSCNGPALTCRNGQCVDNTGFLGGPCLPNNTCNGANRCQEGTCVPCTAGTLHCGCTPQGTCGGSLVCNALMVCAQPGEGAPPSSPKCYSPCQRSLDVDGGARACPSDGLMEGCLGDDTCTQGSCVGPNESIPTCTSDAQCPDYQTCITGHCYSTCDFDAQCQGGKRCFRHVCREPCTATGSSCGNGSYCRTVDGENGFCVPLAGPTGEPVTEVPGGFTVSTNAIEFSNVRTKASITIHNGSPNFQRFVVRKRAHTLTRADNSSETLDDPAADPACNPAMDCPLTWLHLGATGAATRVQEFTIGIDGNTDGTVEIGEAGSVEAVAWQGKLEVRQEKMGSQTVVLTYVERPEGRWHGTMYYFSQFGERRLTEWRATQQTRNDPLLQLDVGNAFIQRWGAFRRGRISWDEFLAVLTATRTESWRWPSVASACPGAANGKACYLYDIGASGVAEYTSDVINFPIPSGLTELPMAMNLRLDPQDVKRMAGRIESSLALQYAGNPAIQMDFLDDPTACGMMNGTSCVTFLTRLDSQIYVGGRYISTQADTECTQGRPDGTFDQMSYPWLLPGFQRATSLNPETGARYRHECRDTAVPFAGANAEETAALQPVNVAMAGANPIPDGRSRQRTLRLVDGALINQSQLFVIFEEEFASFLGANDPGFKSYGYMILERGRANLDTADKNNNQVADVYEGSNVSDTRTQPNNLLNVSCPASLLQEIMPLTPVLNATTAQGVALAIIEGSVGGSPTTLTPSDDEQVHYLCVDTGLFDGGEFNVTPHGVDAATNANSCVGKTNNNLCEDGGTGATSAACAFGTDLADCGHRTTDDRDIRVECPAGSEVIFFSVRSSVLTQAQMAANACNRTHTCSQVLNDWRSSGTSLVQYGLNWRCTDQNRAFCDDNRFDMRDGKTFFAVTDNTQRFVPMHTDIDLAFRYKTRFRNRSGSTVGFAPELCRTGSDLIPYCYDPSTIEKLRERSDCLLAVWRLARTTPSALDQATTTRLENYLDEAFAVREEIFPDNTRQSFDGFEKLYAELLIMQGDENFTKAFASRFDLANSRSVSFQGTEFEGADIGIDLSGVAGFEMYSLHMATQYYQEALDRFYAISPTVGESLALGAGSANFITPLTVTTYFDRLIRASTQKARAWSEIARRYQGFNRPDLARRVVERAFTATYMEATVFSRLMLSIVSAPQFRDQIRRAAEDAARRYRVATMEMRKVYNSITDGVTFFGFTPDFVPLPALDVGVPNAFEMVLARAQEKTRVARIREDEALNSNRAFETDAALFQAELTRIRTTYENQLGAVCGTFQGEDGRIYPAIQKYAQLNPRARQLGDPCGLMGTGSLHESMTQMDLHALDIRGIMTSFDNVFEEVAIEEQRVKNQCNLINTAAEYVYTQSGTVQTMRTAIGATKTVISGAERALSTAQTIAQLAKCSLIAGVAAGGDCPTAVASTAVFLTASVAVNIAAVAAEAAIVGLETGINQIERDTAKWQTEQQCDVAETDSNARTATMLLRIKELEVDLLKAQRRVDLTLSQIRELHNDATRLQLEQAEAEQLSINVEAVRNDPNVRIYKNDAIINADFSFQDAIREAYRATKVYEYYTSQSYPDQEKLFLIRMVGRGDYNLENYLTSLQNEFNTFEEVYGNPDTRVAIISLRDDVLRIPTVDETGKPVADGDRINLLRDKLTAVEYLDERGYLTFPFSTGLDQLSPLTRNHKVLYVEADVIGSSVGDTLGRVYLRQQGTGVVRRLNGEKFFYRMPERTAVLNTLFNGQRIFTPDVYRNYRMRDRPLVNTSWELVLNQRDEAVNRDINLRSLTDIRLYVYYTDFTGF